MPDVIAAKMDRLLLVDDNPTNLQVLFGALEQEGYELLIATSGEEAIKIAIDARPQLILLDINMPGMDGYETCRHLKSDPQTRDAVIIFLSARGDVEDKVHGLELGAVDYVEKPFQFEEVVARVRQHLATFHKHRKLKHENRQLQALIEGGFRELDDEDILVLIDEGESDRVEFKSTLRWNLHTDKPDKRIENACLKTVAAYLNSNGGFLLIGVDDNGQPLGLVSDRFDNEDKLLLHWNGLVKQFLGVQSTPRIRSTILSAGPGRVLVVQCLPSNDPVFFRRDNDELFFVRTGNGTHSLKPSEVLNFLAQRSNSSDSEQKTKMPDSDRVGQYTLGELIGAGGMGSVYRARHAMLHRPAAIKMLNLLQTNETTIERFQREVQLSSQLTHPNTITIYDYGRTSDGSFYYVMELIQGMTLSQLVNTYGPLSSGRVIHVVSQICGALAEAHQAGLVHRDIKPANIMVSYRGGLGDFVKVLDFGLVRPIQQEDDAQITRAGEFCGSPGFVSPETVSHEYEIDARSDLYSLGATVWYLLTGRPVFTGDSLETCLSHVEQTPAKPSEFSENPIDPDLEAIVMQCLEKSPFNRPDTARCLLESLGNCSSHLEWTQQKAADWWKPTEDTQAVSLDDLDPTQPVQYLEE